MPFSESPLDHSCLDAALADLLDAPRWYVGFSGGVDSTVLLHLLQRWCRVNDAAPPLTAIHINHGMQAAAQEWQIHCEWVCKLLHTPCMVRRVEVQADSRGSEAAARAARYRVFEEQLGEGDVLFLAHHLDDQVETFFLRLMRGSGVHGLAAIPARRALGRGRLVRPLLGATREQLEHCAAEQGLEHVEDPSNNNTAMDRNFLRGELLPLLASRWPGYRRTVSRASEHMAGTISALEAALPTPETVYNTLGDPGIALEELLGGTDEAAAVRLRGWLHALGRQAPDQAPMEEFLRQLHKSAAEKNPRLACSAFILQRYRDAVYLLPGSATGAGEGWHMTPFTLAPGDIYDVPGVGRIGLEPAPGDGLLLARGERLLLAWRRGGERCRPLGREGSNTLKKLLQAWDIPPWWRDRVPLLYLDEELLAVGDLWLCESSRWRESAGRGETLWQLSWQPDTQAAGD